MGISINGIYGKLSDSERSKTRNLNFQSKILQGDLNFVFHFDNGLMLPKNSIFGPFVFTGISYLKFDPYGDLKNKNNIPYNYWGDGTIRSIPETDQNATGGTIIQRDYVYETQLKDPTIAYSRHTWSVPIGIGFNLKALHNLSVNVGATYYLTFTDWIDNYKEGKNDKYTFANVSVQYTFGKENDHDNLPYNSIDFSTLDKLDTDGDGVIDLDDKCPGTPKGVKTDNHGCPYDKDEDGVPDYKDKELTTKKNTPVDVNGVTISEKMLFERQLSYNSSATERSDLFNENPSLSSSEEVETTTLKTKEANSTSTNKISLDIKSADTNKDGVISVDEIYAAIDHFFEGDSDFTVEKLNELISFFFEQ